MLIRCTHCATAYEVERDSLGSRGRMVRCARCGTEWFAYRPALEKAAASAPAGLPAAAHAEDAGRAAHDDEAETGAQPALAVPLVAGAPSLAPDADPPGPTIDVTPALDADRPPPFGDIETIAARRARSRAARTRQSGPGLALAVVALGGTLAGLIGYRGEVVRHVPQTAGLYARIGLPVNLRNLAFEDVKTAGETHDGVPVMVVSGRIVNTGRQAAEVPRLRFALRNSAGVEVYAWTAQPPQDELAEGTSVPFRSRLASPPADGRDLQVRFFNRRDLESGQ